MRGRCFFINIETREINKTPNYEINNTNFINETDCKAFKKEDNNFENRSSQTKIRKKDRSVSRGVNLRLLTTFMFLCVTVASVQNFVYIPVFSDYFAPATIQNVIEIDDKPYVTSIKVEITEFEDGSLHIKKKGIYIREININENFDNFANIVVELTNIETNKIYYSGLQPKEHLKYMDIYGCPAFDWEVSKGSAKFKINIYCDCPNPEKLEYSKTIKIDEFDYYLIYEHNEIIKV